jgi:hypothetical protein
MQIHLIVDQHEESLTAQFGKERLPQHFGGELQDWSALSMALS